MPHRDPEEKKRYHRDYQTQRKNTHRIVKVTMTLEQYRHFETFASSRQQTVARTLLFLASSQLDEVPVLHPNTREKIDEIIRLLRASGNNINQIAHACNIRVAFTDDPPTPQEGSKMLAGIHKGMVQLEVLIEKKLS